MSRKKSPMTRAEFCRPIAKALQEFGYSSVTPEQCAEVLTAFLEGKRGRDLPHGVIGMFVERQLNEVEEAKPGCLALLAS